MACDDWQGDGLRPVEQGPAEPLGDSGNYYGIRIGSTASASLLSDAACPVIFPHCP